jgi:hypothetical protein
VNESGKFTCAAADAPEWRRGEFCADDAPDAVPGERGRRMKTIKRGCVESQISVVKIMIPRSFMEICSKLSLTLDSTRIICCRFLFSGGV